MLLALHKLHPEILFLECLDDLLTMLSNEQVSNTFHFTFTVCSDMLKNGLKIRNVVPSTEEEARRILERMEAEGLCN